MGRAIVVACALLLAGVAGCGDTSGDDADAAADTDRPVTTTEAEEPETTTTTRPRPTTTTTTSTTTSTTTTAPPTTTTTTAPPPPPPPTTTAPPAAPSGCDPNYTGACVPIASDVDCAGGSGNGPEYVQGPVTIVGTDIYDLDGGGTPGIGCEG